MTNEQIETLRTHWAAIDRIDPLAPTYTKLIALLDRLDQPSLVLVAKSNIKFVSKLAANRIRARGV